MIHLKAIFKVDVFVPATGLAKQQLARRQSHEIEEQRIWIAIAEDTILAKLEWYRLGKEVCELQWRDVMGIIGIQGSRLDFDYLKSEARNLGLIDLLERAVEQSR